MDFQNSHVVRQEPHTAFPVANSDVGTQWHVTDGGIDGFFEKISSFPLLPVRDNLKTILNGRHFLGWVSQAQVKLGTERPTDLSSGALEEMSGIVGPIIDRRPSPPEVTTDITTF
jgi:hypothetical protein